MAIRNFKLDCTLALVRLVECDVSCEIAASLMRREKSFDCIFPYTFGEKRNLEFHLPTFRRTFCASRIFHYIRENQLLPAVLFLIKYKERVAKSEIFFLCFIFFYSIAGNLIKEYYICIA